METIQLRTVSEAINWTKAKAISVFTQGGAKKRGFTLPENNNQHSRQYESEREFLALSQKKTEKSNTNAEDTRIRIEYSSPAGG